MEGEGGSSMQPKLKSRVMSRVFERHLKPKLQLPDYNEMRLAQDRSLAEEALKYFNKINYPEYEFVEAICSHDIHFLQVFHINFVAKPVGTNPDAIKRFFAEVKSSEVFCCILPKDRLERKGRCKYCAKYGIRTPNRGFFYVLRVTKKIHPWSLESGNALAFASEVVNL